MDTESERKMRIGRLLVLLTMLSVWGWGQAVPGLKPHLVGLVAMNELGFFPRGANPPFSLVDAERRPGIFQGVVLNVTWDQLEKRDNQFDLQPIEDALARVRRYNAEHADTPLRVRLRIYGGLTAPEWAKQLGGAALPLEIKKGPRTDVPVTLGRFWSEPYRAAWRSLLDYLGARYDAEPLIAEVANTSCMSQSGEAMIVPAQPESITTLRAAGYTDAAFQACLADSWQDYRAWPSTSVDMAFNPYRSLEAGTNANGEEQAQPDPTIAPALILAWRQRMGTRGVVSQHALQTPLPDHLQPIYSQLVKTGAPLTFQTVSPAKIQWRLTLRYGIRLGATSIELWPSTEAGGMADYPEGELSEWSAALLANAKAAGL